MEPHQSFWVRHPTSGTAVVFVHGVLSDGDACWQADNGTYWPDLLKQEPGLAGIGIYVFSYRTSKTSGNYTISDAMRELEAALQAEKVLALKHIIFVCHSLGGIVVRQFLVTRQMSLADTGVRIGLFLVASPSLGSDYANLLSALVTVMGHAQGQVLRFADDNQVLMDLDANFMRLLKDGRPPVVGKELLEDTFIAKSLFKASPVVRAFSAGRYFADPLKIADSTHVSIAKPENATARQHTVLVQFINECLALAAAAASRPAADARIRVGLVGTGDQVEWRNFRGIHVTIGRGPENDVVVDDPKVSWEHGVVAVEQGVFVYRHIGRSNASLVRSRGREARLTAGGLTETALANQDRLTIGSRTLILELVGAAKGIYIRTDNASEAET